MLKVNSYSAKGIKLTPVTLPKEWEEKINMPLLNQAIHIYRDRLHVGLAKTKTRAEVNRTTKKLYKQKGTGGARHGSRKAPIFVGGGIAHGPRPISRILTIPQELRRKALGIAITLAVKDGRIAVVSLSNIKKTKEVTTLKSKIKMTDSKKTTFVLPKENYPVKKFLRNMKDTNVLLNSNINAYEIFFGGNIIFDKESISEPKENTEKTTPKTKAVKTVKKENKK